MVRMNIYPLFERKYHLKRKFQDGITFNRSTAIDYMQISFVRVSNSLKQIKSVVDEI